MKVARWIGVAVAALALGGSGPALARVVTVGAGGAVANVFTSNGGSTTVPIGAGFGLSFSFDTDSLVLVASASDISAYRFDVLSINAQVGDYVFDPARTTGVVNFSRAFANFGGPASERVLNQSFFFLGKGDGAPFSFPTPTINTNLGLSSTLRYGTEVPPIDESALTDPALAARSSFSLAGVTVAGPSRASVAGIAVGNFVTAGVPEPATWGMMILGFGAIGIALRRRSMAGRSAAA